MKRHTQIWRTTFRESEANPRALARGRRSPPPRFGIDRIRGGNYVCATSTGTGTRAGTGQRADIGSDTSGRGGRRKRTRAAAVQNAVARQRLLVELLLIEHKGGGGGGGGGGRGRDGGRCRDGRRRGRVYRRTRARKRVQRLIVEFDGSGGARTADLHKAAARKRCGEKRAINRRRGERSEKTPFMRARN